ncbi:MAG: hypothetical protein U9N61_00055 [Euryarchaeota archaeon]|nr:hypothetical protein [Euryarchaeota archaeon]
MNKRIEEQDAFSNHLERRLKKIEDTLHSKAAVYASKENRLHNFDVAARITNCTPEQALQGMMMKHIVSVLDLVQWAEITPERITEQLVDEKIGDTINYLILLELLFLRRIQGKEKRTKKGKCLNVVVNG